MMKNTDIAIKNIASGIENYTYRAPMKFGGRVVDSVTILNVCAEVESRDGKRGVGYGSMTMGNAWAWISSAMTNDQTLSAMVDFGQKVREWASTLSGFHHPLEWCQQFSQHYQSVADDVREEVGFSEAFPRLAQLVAASPLEAAMFDAYGKMLGRSSFQLLGPDFVNTDLSAYLGDDFQGEYLEQYVLPHPKKRMPLYHLVGGLDPLTEADIPKRLNDGLPETLEEWILADGLTHLKIKLNGEDLRQDVERCVAIETITSAAQSQRGVKEWYYSADFNEKCRDEEYVLEWLRKMEERSPHMLACLQYIEQPTNRDLKALPRVEMFRVARQRPVVIDESLVDLESLLLSRELGYSGVALKACKGHSEALLMGAAAQKYGLFLCVQDLTCPGASFLHSASLAAHIPTVAAIEGNGRQYCPCANAGYAEKYPEIFRISDGSIQTEVLDEPGLGFTF
ncbi:MAG: mandelate racemase/muconate lactonizing enzyme family protein [Planctomycetia bacterium]|nr:mandelate racemase/muconate lactonizing enzyme family protein [Planctomycetia bacterium]